MRRLREEAAHFSLKRVVGAERFVSNRTTRQGHVSIVAIEEIHVMHVVGNAGRFAAF
jgi:hypothetical protein